MLETEQLKSNHKNNLNRIDSGEEKLEESTEPSFDRYLAYDLKGNPCRGEYDSSKHSGILLFRADDPLLLISTRYDRLFQSLTRWVRMVGRLEPTILKVLLDRKLNVCFSPLETSRLQRYYLIKRRLYSLNESMTEYVYVLRQKALLVFHLNSEQYISLEPHDELVLLSTEKIQDLKNRGVWTAVLSQTAENRGFLRIDDHLPRPNSAVNRGRKCRRIKWIGRWTLFLFYATLTGVLLLMVFWIL